jgi:hypothetical protein
VLPGLALLFIRSRPCAACPKDDRRRLGQNEGIDGLIAALNHNADLLTGTNQGVLVDKI